MAKIKCYDVLEMVITDNNGDICGFNDDAVEELRRYCEMIDKFSDAHDGIAYEVEVDDECMHVSISIYCEGFDVVGKHDIFYDILKVAKSYSVRVSQDNSENVRITFTFDSFPSGV